MKFECPLQPWIEHSKAALLKSKGWIHDQAIHLSFYSLLAIKLSALGNVSPRGDLRAQARHSRTSHLFPLV